MKILKKVFFGLIMFILSGTVYSQNVPGTVSYQAVARSETGSPIANKEIIIEISIRKTSSTGAIEYQEIHNPVTNEFGLFDIEIGAGKNTFSGILDTFSRPVGL